MNIMIKTAIEHAAIAVAMQLCLAFYLYHVHSFTADHGLLAGGFAACAAFLFREIAQHEYKGGGPYKVNILYGLTKHWTLDSILDLVFPVIATGGVWLTFKLV